MAPDSFKNLGFGDDADAPSQAPNAATATPPGPRSQPPSNDNSRAS